MSIAARFIEKLTKDERGTTAIEYALIATLVVIVIIGAINLLSSDLDNTFKTIANTVAPAI
jgi:pilus assembly protein Flp/PilA